MLEKSEKLIMQAFREMKTPSDFNDDINMMMLVDALSGLVSRSITNERISKIELDNYNLNEDTKKKISPFVSRSSENLIYYNLIKTCFLIMYKYKR